MTDIKDVLELAAGDTSPAASDAQLERPSRPANAAGIGW
jgi:hypothetical protein